MQLSFNFNADPVAQELEFALGEPVEHYRLYEKSEYIRFFKVLTSEQLIDLSLAGDSCTIFMRYTRSKLSRNLLCKVLQTVIEGVMPNE